MLLLPLLPLLLRRLLKLKQLLLIVKSPSTSSNYRTPSHGHETQPSLRNFTAPLAGGSHLNGRWICRFLPAKRRSFTSPLTTRGKA